MKARPAIPRYDRWRCIHSTSGNRATGWRLYVTSNNKLRRHSRKMSSVDSCQFGSILFLSFLFLFYLSAVTDWDQKTALAFAFNTPRTELLRGGGGVASGQKCWGGGGGIYIGTTPASSIFFVTCLNKSPLLVCFSFVSRFVLPNNWSNNQSIKI